MKLNTDLCEEIVSNLKLIYNKIESGLYLMIFVFFQ